jgi:hypothetical protein
MSAAIWEVIVQENARINQLVDLVLSSQGEDVDHIYVALADTLEVRARLEREMILPLVEREDDELADTLDAQAEEIEDLLLEMDDADLSPEDFRERFTELNTLLRSRIAAEETRLLPLLKEVIDGEHAEALGDQYQRRREEEMASAAPPDDKV